MFDVTLWMAKLIEGLKAAFGDRLLFVGLQGSYGRGEAGPDSDIDAVTVLDRLDSTDLDTYRALISTMPRREKACGFICGREELRLWPRYDTAQLERDTLPLYGSKEGLFPTATRKDLAEGAQIGAANLYHALCHSYLYGSGADHIRQRCKEAFFVLRALHELRTGAYVAARRDLADEVQGTERDILLCAMGEPVDSTSEELWTALLRWTSAVLQEIQKFT